MTDSVRRLNMGSGYINPPDWTNVDMLDYGGNVVADVLKGLPFPDNHFDCIVAHHSLQMVRFDDLPRALTELRRVLKVGGTLRISVPDFEWASALHYTDQASRLPIANDIEPTGDGKFLRFIFWHGDAQSAFTATSLIDTLKRNGFQNIRKCEFRQTFCEHTEIISLDSREDESLIVEGIK